MRISSAFSISDLKVVMAFCSYKAGPLYTQYSTLSNENGTIVFLDFSLAWVIPTKPQIPSDVPIRESQVIPLESWNVKNQKKFILTFYLKPSILDGERPPVGVKVSLAGSGVSYQSHILLTGWNNVLKRFIRFIDINFRALSIKSGMPPKRKQMQGRKDWREVYVSE